MKQYYSYMELKARFSQLGYQWPTFHLIGIRATADLVDVFDDIFYLINGGKLEMMTGTTNPGLYWHKNFTKANGGVAVLKPGQYLDTWKLGKHRGLYEAWTQIKPVTVYRDANKNGKSERTEITQNGLFGINIHRASDKWISKVVDKWSAGCQVLNNPKEFDRLIRLSKAYNQKTFTYTLLEEF